MWLIPRHSFFTFQQLWNRNASVINGASYLKIWGHFWNNGVFYNRCFFRFNKILYSGPPAHDVKLKIPVHSQETFWTPKDPLQHREQESEKPEEIRVLQGRKMAYPTPFPPKSPKYGRRYGLWTIHIWKMADCSFLEELTRSNSISHLDAWVEGPWWPRWENDGDVSHRMMTMIRPNI